MKRALVFFGGSQAPVTSEWTLVRHGRELTLRLQVSSGRRLEVTLDRVDFERAYAAEFALTDQERAAVVAGDLPAPLSECSHPEAKSACMPRDTDGRCVWCERELPPLRRAGT